MCVCARPCLQSPLYVGFSSKPQRKDTISVDLKSKTTSYIFFFGWLSTSPRLLLAICGRLFLKVGEAVGSLGPGRSECNLFVDGRNPAPLRKHRKPLLVSTCRAHHSSSLEEESRSSEGGPPWPLQGSHRQFGWSHRRPNLLGEMI